VTEGNYILFSGTSLREIRELQSKSFSVSAGEGEDPDERDRK
jgi:hypothetical protein